MRAGVQAMKVEGKALGELYALHAPDALRLAYLLTGDPGLAEDLVQDAFVRIAGRFLHVRSRDMFHAYLRATLVNLARSRARHRMVEQRYAERVTSTDRVGSPDVSDREWMRVALMGLPVRQRTAIVLRYYEDLSEAQVGELMRCRPTAVRSLVARGMTALRSSLGGPLDE